MVISEDNESSFDFCPEKRPLSKSSWVHRFFVASLTLIGICLAGLVLEKYRPSVANAVGVQKLTSTQSVQKSCISSINQKALHDLSSYSSNNSLLDKRLSQHAAFKTKIIEQVPSKTLFVSMEKTELPLKAFARRVEGPSFKIKRSLAPKCQAFPGTTYFNDGLSFSQKIVEKQFTLPYSTVKIQIIEDPSLVMTFKPAYERLTDVNLSYPDQLKILYSTLRKTCMYSTVSSTSTFTEKGRSLLSQKTYGLHFILTHPFDCSDSFINRASHSFCSSLAWPKPAYPWPQLKQKYFHLIKSDLAKELVDLDRDFADEAPYFPLAAKVNSLAPEYFHRRALETFKIIDESMELARKQSKIADKHALIISANDKLSNIRSQTLVSEFDNKYPHQRPYEQLFCSTTGKERIVSDRELFSLSSLVFEQDLCCNFYSF